MKRFKRFLSLFLVFAMAVSVLPLGTLAADEEDPVEGQVASEEVFGQLSEEAAIETEEEPNQKAKDTVRALTDGGAELLSIEVTTPPTRLDYMYGETDVDMTGMVITASYSDNTTREITAEDPGLTVSSIVLENGDEEELYGPQTIYVYYGEETASFEITVCQSTVLTADPVKDEYTVKDEDSAAEVIAVLTTGGLALAGQTIKWVIDDTHSGTASSLTTDEGKVTVSIPLYGLAPGIVTGKLIFETVKNPDYDEYFYGQ